MSSLGPNGLVIDSLQTIIANLTVGMQAIYGPDINVDSNSPDGQLINLFAQSVADIQQTIMLAYTSFSVDSAFGTVLDQRVSLNGIARRQGTYTITNVLVIVNQALTLTGLDGLVSDPTAQVFTVADNAGNQFQLITTHVFSGSGSATLAFQAAQVGQIQTTPNTITNQVTTVLGVASVNNPSAATSTGVDEETDAQLKVRRIQSFALASTGPADAVQAALAAIADVTDAYVVENATDGEIDGVGANTIWPIVTGGTAAEIAQAIYAKKGIGCAMKGSNSFVVARPNGTSFVAQWDTSIAQPLYVRFTINPVTPGQSFDTSLLATQLAEALEYQLAQAPNVGQVIQAMLTLAPTAYLTAIGVSANNSDFFDVVQPTDAQYYYTISPSNIAIST